MVTLSVDGRVVSVCRGTTILEAAREAGARIPTVCHDRRLEPYGACGLCLVETEVDGIKHTVRACLTPVEDGMRVSTRSPSVMESRRMQLMLLLRSHPLQCPTCDAAGDCRFQQLVHEHEIADLPFSRETRRYYVENNSHFIRFNMDVCIRCGLCVRICDEVQGEGQLSFVHRGIEFDVSTGFGGPLDCELCGQCVQICPVGAITSKWLVGTGRQFELKKTNTVCSFCSIGCALTFSTKEKKTVYVTSPPDSPYEGTLCVKGRYGWPYVYSQHRPAKPLIRRQGRLQPVEWDEALEFVAEGFLRIKNRFGPESLGAFGSARLSNEAAYVLNRFVRTVLDTPHLDHAGGYAYRPLVDGLLPAYGYAAGTNSIREIRNASVIMLLGADLTETHPVAKNEVIMATGPARGGRVIVVDAIRAKLCFRPGIHLETRPGTEHLVAYAMLKVIIESSSVPGEDLDIDEHEFRDLADSLEQYDPARVGRLASVDPHRIRAAALEYARAERAAIILTTGMTRQGNTLALTQAAASMALITGRLGKPSCGVHVFGEKANSQGAVDMGLAPELLPGCYSLLDERAREKFEITWGSPLPRSRGMDARTMLRAAEKGDLRALYVVGENPLETYPDRKQVERALKSLDFLVVQDLFPTATANIADAALPVASLAESNGTLTSADRRVQRVRRVVEPDGNKSDLEILNALTTLMGKPPMSYADPGDVMNEIATVVDSYRGISYERLERGGIQWPCMDSEDSGAGILYERGFPRRRPKLTPAPPIGETRSEEGLMCLIPTTLKFHSGSFSQWSSTLMEACPEAFAEMSSQDLDKLELEDGDFVMITSVSGDSVRVRVKESSRAAEGLVLVPYHFHALKLNNLTKWEQPFVMVRSLTRIPAL